MASWRLSRFLWALLSPPISYARAVAPIAVPTVYGPLVVLAIAGYGYGVGWGILAALAALALGLGSLADGGGGRGLSLETLQANLTASAEESRRRAGAVRVRRRWALTCQSLGWETATPTGPMRPALRHVEALGDRLRVAFRPRGNTDPQTWPAEVDRLRRELGMHSAHHAEHPREPGTVVATFGRVPLPDRVDAAPAGAGADARITLGPKAGGGTARWVLAETPGLLLTGSTGGGKGGTIRVILRDLLESGVRVRVIDPKATGEYRWADEAGAKVARGLEESLASLRFIAQEIRDRCALLYAHGVDRVAALPVELRPALGVVVVDEAADLLMLRRVPTERAADDLRAEAGALLSIVASQGRAAGIHVAVAIQRADASLLGPAGGFLRDNLAGRIGLGRLSVEGLDMMFGPGHRDLVVALTGRPGRALAMNLAAGETTPYALQVGHLEAADLLPAGWTPDVPAVNGSPVAA
jgi:hypothetical protein